jgi:hypothetical protein
MIESFAVEHSQAILVLVEEKLFASALALMGRRVPGEGRVKADEITRRRAGGRANPRLSAYADAQTGGLTRAAVA